MLHWSALSEGDGYHDLACVDHVLLYWLAIKATAENAGGEGNWLWGLATVDLVYNAAVMDIESEEIVVENHVLYFEGLF